jgi:hypothetical protein
LGNEKIIKSKSTVFVLGFWVCWVAWVVWLLGFVGFVGFLGLLGVIDLQGVISDAKVCQDCRIVAILLVSLCACIVSGSLQCCLSLCLSPFVCLLQCH